MKTWQTLILITLFLLVVCVLLSALSLALPLIVGPPTPTPTITPTSTTTPTSTPMASPTRSRPTHSPSPMPSPTNTPVAAIYLDPYLICWEEVHDDLTALLQQLQDAASDEIVLCNLVPAAMDDLFRVRLHHARCPDPTDTDLFLLQFAYETALQYGDSNLRNLDSYCQYGESWYLDMANDDLEEMAHWIREATIQLADYASR